MQIQGDGELWEDKWTADCSGQATSFAHRRPGKLRSSAPLADRKIKGPRTGDRGQLVQRTARAPRHVDHSTCRGSAFCIQHDDVVATYKIAWRSKFFCVCVEMVNARAITVRIRMTPSRFIFHLERSIFRPFLCREWHPWGHRDALVSARIVSARGVSSLITPVEAQEPTL